MKKGEIVWDKMGVWILLIILLVILLVFVYIQKGNFGDILESLKTVFRFGG
jgi:hypothetical protein